jgi:hypothetical protein
VLTDQVSEGETALSSHQAPFIEEDGAAFLDEYPAG